MVSYKVIILGGILLVGFVFMVWVWIADKKMSKQKFRKDKDIWRRRK